VRATLELSNSLSGLNSERMLVECVLHSWYIARPARSCTAGQVRESDPVARCKSAHPRSAATWLPQSFVCAGLFFLLIPLVAAQRSSVENSKVQKSIPEEPSAVEVQLAPELDPLRDCLARSDRKCAMEAFSKLRDPKLNDDPQYLDLSAQLMSLENKEPGALAAIDRAIRMEPTRASYVMTKGKIFQRAHDQAKAIQFFLQAAQLRPGWIEPVYSLGMSFFIVGNEEKDNEYYDRGARHFKAALELDPNCHKAEFMLGVVEALEEHHEKGKEHFEKALKMSPQNAYYHLEYGVLLNRTGDSDGALREMRLAEALDHSNTMTYFNLGRLETRLENYSEARRQLETAVQLDPNLSVAYYWLGRVYHRLGLSELSQAAYKNFELAKAREQQEEADPIEAALSQSDLATRDSLPEQDSRK
jgi:tetratricopeptide (TPR) repeat protein